MKVWEGGVGVVPKGESETFPCTIGVQGKGVKGFLSASCVFYSLFLLQNEL